MDVAIPRGTEGTTEGTVTSYATSDPSGRFLVHARGARFNVPGAVYHVISRFVDRDWFIESEDERSLYLSLLGRALLESDWRWDRSRDTNHSRRERSADSDRRSALVAHSP